MKYNDNGEYKEIVVKSADTLPVGTEVDFDGNEVPSGWTEKSINKINIDLTTGSAYSTFGGCYYYKIGNRVHIHIGISGLTANTQATIFTMPTGYRPSTYSVATGIGSTLSNTSSMYVQSSGLITILSSTQYALIDMDYEVDNGKIQKTSQYIEGGASLSNVYGTSQSNGYSQEYINNAFGGVVLWTNSSPTSNFVGQQITLNDNLNNYDYYEVLYDENITNQSCYSTGKILSNKMTRLLFSGTYNKTRAITNISDNKLTFSNGYINETYGSGTITNDNSIIIPLQIIGYKSSNTTTTQQTRSISNDEEVVEEDNR